VFWLLDYLYCDGFADYRLYPWGHSAWHILTAVALYQSNALLKTIKAKTI
jgi:hypothetical protein